MNKLKIVAMATGILLLAGCSNQAVQNQNGDAQNAQNQKQEQKGSGMISSIKDAMGLGKTMRCTYRIQNENGGNDEIVTYVEGEKYATQMNVAGQKQRMVYDGETIHSWQEGQKQGMKMTKACTDEMDASMPEDDEEPEDVPEFDAENAFDEAMDVKCEEVSNADFSVPSNVEFVDQCEMLKGIMKNIPGGAGTGVGAQNGTGMPGGMDIPNIPNMPKM
jgi:Spy/CpxP family protein refolding chaperone